MLPLTHASFTRIPPLLLSTPTPSSYVPEPKTFLHHASAEVKQLWTVAVLLLMARAATPVRAGIAALLVAATMLALPRRLWQPQLLRLGALSGVLFFFTLIGAQAGAWGDMQGPAAAALPRLRGLRCNGRSCPAPVSTQLRAWPAMKLLVLPFRCPAGAEGVPPVLSNRAVPEAAAAAGAGAAAAVAAELPSSMAALGAAPYRYVLFHFGWITVTKRSLNLAIAFAGLTFAALQGASLCLVTTPPEAMAAAVGRALAPLGLLGLPVKELVLTQLLALRFMATVGG